MTVYREAENENFSEVDCPLIRKKSARIAGKNIFFQAFLPRQKVYIRQPCLLQLSGIRGLGPVGVLSPMHVTVHAPDIRTNVGPCPSVGTSAIFESRDADPLLGTLTARQCAPHAYIPLTGFMLHGVRMDIGNATGAFSRGPTWEHESRERTSAYT